MHTAATLSAPLLNSSEAVAGDGGGQQKTVSLTGTSYAVCFHGLHVHAK